MKSSFLEYYRANLEHIRELSGEFAMQYPKIASRLNISAQQTQDPFIERMLEGVAFLAAKVEKKFDDGYPLFLQSLLQRLSPSMCVPIPSATVVSVDLSNLGYKTLNFTAGEIFETSATASTNNVRFSSVWNENLIDAKVTNVNYVLSLANELTDQELAGLSIKSGICVDINFASPDRFKGQMPDDLCFFLNMPDSDNSSLAEALEQGMVKAYLKSGEELFVLDGFSSCIRSATSEENVFRKALHILPGISAMQLFFNYPFLSHFVVMKGLGKALAAFGRDNVKLIIAFDRQVRFTRNLRPDSILLNCIALVNIFERRADRTPIKCRHESLCELSHTSPLDYEIYSVDKVEIYNASNQQQSVARPFYTSNIEIDNEKEAVLFALRRAERLNGLYKKRSTYTKTDVFVSFAGEQYHSYDEEKESEFTAVCWATNGDLPLFCKSISIFSNRDGKIKGTSILPLTRPTSPVFMRGNTDGFIGLSYVMMNVSALLYQDSNIGKNVLRQMIGAFYGGNADEKTLMQNALYEFKTKKTMFRFVQFGKVFYEQGYELTVTLDEKELTGVGVYAFGVMLKNLISDYCAINLPIKFKIRGVERGEIATWDQDSI